MMSSSYLILAIASLLSPSLLSAAEWLDCGPAKNFHAELEDNTKVFVHDANIRVKYDRNELAVYEYPDVDAVNILINNTLVSFSGHIVPDNEKVDHDAFKTSRVFSTKIAGTAELTKTDSSNALAECNLYVSRNPNEGDLGIPKRLQTEILHQAVSCMKSTLCQQLGAVSLDDMRRAKSHPFNFGKVSALSRMFEQEYSKIANALTGAKPKVSAGDLVALIKAYRGQNHSSENADGLQENVNKFVDVVIQKLVKNIAEEKLGKIKIPDIQQRFSVGSGFLETTGEFHATDGTFEELSTLKRTRDVALKMDGSKFVLSFGFGLTKANMDYLRYKLRFGIIKVYGRLIGSVDGVALDATVGVDYNQKPCRTVLQELRVSHVGKLKVNMTGLGPLNKLLSKLVTYITQKWQGEIVTLIERQLKGLIVNELNKLNCEQFRP